MRRVHSNFIDFDTLYSDKCNSGSKAGKYHAVLKCRAFNQTHLQCTAVPLQLLELQLLLTDTGMWKEMDFTPGMGVQNSIWVPQFRHRAQNWNLQINLSIMKDVLWGIKVSKKKQDSNSSESPAEKLEVKQKKQDG